MATMKSVSRITNKTLIDDRLPLPNVLGARKHTKTCMSVKDANKKVYEHLMEEKRSPDTKGPEYYKDQHNPTRLVQESGTLPQHVGHPTHTPDHFAVIAIVVNSSSASSLSFINEPCTRTIYPKL